MRTITKRELAKRVKESGAGNFADARSLVEAAIELIKEALASGEDVIICRFGKFRIRGKTALKGRNFKTGEALIISPRRVITFHPSGGLRKRCKAVPI